jgi:hypothetical protein
MLTPHYVAIVPHDILEISYQIINEIQSRATYLTLIVSFKGPTDVNEALKVLQRLYLSCAESNPLKFNLTVLLQPICSKDYSKFTHWVNWNEESSRSFDCTEYPFPISTKFNANSAIISKVFTGTFYTDAVLGGTFDHLHNGHKLLLSTASLISTKRVLCGISGKYEELL